MPTTNRIRLRTVGARLGALVILIGLALSGNTMYYAVFGMIMASGYVIGLVLRLKGHSDAHARQHPLSERPAANAPAGSERESLLRRLTDRTFELLAALAEMQRQQSAVEKQAAQTEAVLASMADGVTVIDRRGQITHYKSGIASLIWAGDGADPDRKVGVRLKHVDGTQVQEEQRLDRRLLRGESPLEVEYRVETSEPGEHHRLKLSGSTAFDFDGEPELAVIVTRDVTQLRQLEQAKDDYLQVIAHELRNPLSAALGLVQLASGRVQSYGLVDAGRHLGLAQAELYRVASLVSDIVAGYAVSSGRLRLNLRRVDLVEMVERCIASHAPAGDAVTKMICIDLPPAPVLVNGDEERLLATLDNLISNAIKYSSGIPRLWVTLTSGFGQAVITVADEGIGIPKDQLQRIFDGFYRASNVTARQPGGLGLGLYVGRDVIRRHGGDIWATNRQGGGTVMSVNLPLLEQGAPGLTAQTGAQPQLQLIGPE